MHITKSAGLFDIFSILPPKQLPRDMASAQKNPPARKTERPITKMSEYQHHLSFNSIVSVFVSPSKAA